MAAPPDPPVPTADPGPVGGDPIALSPPTYERHAAAVRWVEQQNRGRTPRGSRSRRPWTQSLYRATNGGGVIASGGSADATITYADGTTETVTVHNWFNGNVPASKKMLIGWVDGDWYAVSWDC